jgi:hypothetical protein
MYALLSYYNAHAYVTVVVRFCGLFQAAENNPDNRIVGVTEEKLENT